MDEAKKVNLKYLIKVVIDVAFEKCKTDDDFIDSRKFLVDNGFDVDFVQNIIVQKNLKK